MLQSQATRASRCPYLRGCMARRRHFAACRRAGAGGRERGVVRLARRRLCAAWHGIQHARVQAALRLQPLQPPGVLLRFARARLARAGQQQLACQPGDAGQRDNGRGQRRPRAAGRVRRRPPTGLPGREFLDSEFLQSRKDLSESEGVDVRDCGMVPGSTTASPQAVMNSAGVMPSSPSPSCSALISVPCNTSVPNSASRQAPPPR